VCHYSTWRYKLISAYFIKPQSNILSEVFKESELPQSSIDHVIIYFLHNEFRVIGFNVIKLLLANFLSEYLKHSHGKLFLESQEPFPT
jgi:hypothetical protein